LKVQLVVCAEDRGAALNVWRVGMGRRLKLKDPEKALLQKLQRGTRTMVCPAHAPGVPPPERLKEDGHVPL
jgi:hypothetical protein